MLPLEKTMPAWKEDSHSSSNKPVFLDFLHVQ